MKINDEMLSAYLDNELSGPDRAMVEASLRDDGMVADRLAQLDRVNALVGKQAALIDSMPLPASVLAMLQGSNTQTGSGIGGSGNVVELSGFRQAHRRVMHIVREHAALAASLALLIGFAGGQMVNRDSSSVNNSSLYAALDSVPSGQQIKVEADTTMTARFSFQDSQTRYCRQFMLQDSQGSSENLACRDKDQWTIVASARSSAVASSAQYQPASGPHLLEDMLDTMMQGSALSQADEQIAINNQWIAE